MSPAVALVPMGQVPGMTLKVIAGNIAGCLDLVVDILPGVPLHQTAFHPSRDQYNAAVIIEYLESMENIAHGKILGILGVDLFLPIFTHVFGDARMGGRAGAMSLFRLSRRPNENPLKISASEMLRPENLAMERGAKVALHEIGHLFSLIHCSDPECVMHFSGGIDHLDRLPLYFCKSCLRKLHAAFSASA